MTQVVKVLLPSMYGKVDANLISRIPEANIPEMGHKSNDTIAEGHTRSRRKIHDARKVPEDVSRSPICCNCIELDDLWVTSVQLLDPSATDS